MRDGGRASPSSTAIRQTSSSDPAPNFFSFHSDGAGWTAGLGTYAYRTLGWRHAVLVADLEDDVFNWTQAAGFVAEFCSLGGTITKRVWVPAGTQDYSAVIGGVPSSGVDGFFFATYPQTILAFARGYPGLRGNISSKVIPGTFPDLGGLADHSADERVASSEEEPREAAASTPTCASFRAAFPQEDPLVEGATSTSSTTMRRLRR